MSSISYQSLYLILILFLTNIVYASESPANQQVVRNLENINSVFSVTKSKDNNFQYSAVKITKSQFNKDMDSLDIVYTCDGIIINGVELKSD